jgi:hypothetical protein
MAAGRRPGESPRGTALGLHASKAEEAHPVKAGKGGGGGAGKPATAAELREIRVAPRRTAPVNPRGHGSLRDGAPEPVERTTAPT